MQKTEDKLNVGMRKANVLCQMSPTERLKFLAEGLPIILTSAREYYQAAEKSKDMPRIAKILLNLGEEEIAKILILMDIVRCPRNLVNSNIGKMTKWFYDHRVRLTYTNAIRWKPMHVAQLREYVDLERNSHELDGFAGEICSPNQMSYERERLQYVDIASPENGEFEWIKPESWSFNFDIIEAASPLALALELAEAMCTVGIFTSLGLEITSEIWGQVTFRDSETFEDSEYLTKMTSKGLIKNNCYSDTVQQGHLSSLCKHWQLPMYDFDFGLIQVTSKDVTRIREGMLNSEIGKFF